VRPVSDVRDVFSNHSSTATLSDFAINNSDVRHRGARRESRLNFMASIGFLWSNRIRIVEAAR
jgi:hypothetical protein